MKMTRLYPLALGSHCSPPLLMPRLHSKTKARWWLPPVRQSSRSASANNVSSTVVSAPELSDAGVTASDKLPRVLPGLNIENSGNMLFRQSRYAASLQRRTSITPPSPCMSMASLSFPPTPSRRLPMCKAWSCCEAHRNVIWQKRSGGIINIVTQQPDSTPRGYIEGGVSSRDSYPK